MTIDTKRLADTLVDGAKTYIDKTMAERFRPVEDRLLVLETLLADVAMKTAKPVVRVKAGGAK